MNWYCGDLQTIPGLNRYPIRYCRPIYFFLREQTGTSEIIIIFIIEKTITQRHCWGWHCLLVRWQQATLDSKDSLEDSRSPEQNRLLNSYWSCQHCHSCSVKTFLSLLANNDDLKDTIVTHFNKLESVLADSECEFTRQLRITYNLISVQWLVFLHQQAGSCPKSYHRSWKGKSKGFCTVHAHEDSRCQVFQRNTTE